MPDPTRATLSATETPALFGASPYVTRWMLYQKFAKGLSLDSAGDARMNWGTKLQPLILAQAAADLRLDVRPNADDSYHRRGLLGCTRDATIICPDRGPGALETKCVFDYTVWMQDWQGGKAPPRQHEIQLQQQMFVGDETGPYRWGVIAAWLAGDVHYFEREPIPELWAALETETARFFDDVKAAREPNAFGSPAEYPLMQQLFATETGRVLDMREDPDAAEYANDVGAYVHSGESEWLYSKERERLKLKLLALMSGADECLLPGGVKLTLKRAARAGYTVKPTTTITLRPYLPASLEDMRMAG